VQAQVGVAEVVAVQPERVPEVAAGEERRQREREVAGEAEARLAEQPEPWR
jgi:hypothetical protein